MFNNDMYFNRFAGGAICVECRGFLPYKDLFHCRGIDQNWLFCKGCLKQQQNVNKRWKPGKVEDSPLVKPTF